MTAAAIDSFVYPVASAAAIDECPLEYLYQRLRMIHERPTVERHLEWFGPRSRHLMRTIFRAKTSLDIVLLKMSESAPNSANTDCELAVSKVAILALLSRLDRLIHGKSDRLRYESSRSDLLHNLQEAIQGPEEVRLIGLVHREAVWFLRRIVHERDLNAAIRRRLGLFLSIAEEAAAAEQAVA